MAFLGARLTGVDACLRELADSLDDEGAIALESLSREIASDAAANHDDASPDRARYCNRTGNLTASIEALRPMGSLTEGTLVGGVVAGMEYASYVEEGTDRARPFPYLGPAADVNATEEQVEAIGEHAISRAARGTEGWRP